MKILSGTSNPPLSAKVASLLDLSLVKTSFKMFPDKEILVEIYDDLKGEDIFLIQSTSYPVNDHLMELLITLNTLEQAFPRSITAIIPYYGYSRQDRPSTDQSSMASKLIARLLEVTSLNKIITLDLHAPQISPYFKTPLYNLSTASLFSEDIRVFHALENLLIVSPDAGGHERAHLVAHSLNVKAITLHKTRDKNTNACHIELNDSVQNKDCIIIDDIVDTGETLCKASDLLIEKGAKSVNAYCTHQVLSGSALDKITLSPLQQIVFTDSIYAPFIGKDTSKLRYLSVAPLLAKAIHSYA